MIKIKKILITVLSVAVALSTMSISASAKIDSTASYTFDVISDTHIDDPSSKYSTTNAATANRNTATALKAIKKSFPEDRCIVVNGDVVDNYWDSAYNQMYNIFHTANSDGKLPYVYFNFGNHEFRRTASNSSEAEWYDWSISQFNTYTRKVQTELTPNGVSYDARGEGQAYDWQYVNNSLFFFLGSSKIEYDGYNDCALLDSSSQLANLDKKLSEGRLTFLFCHQPPTNTVHGSDSYNSIHNTSEFNSIISKYKKAIMFTSHTHNDFNTYKFFGSNSNFSNVGNASIFGTSSILEGPQGCHVEVYSDGVIVYGVRYKTNGSYDILTKRTVNF